MYCTKFISSLFLFCFSCLFPSYVVAQSSNTTTAVATKAFFVEKLWEKYSHPSKNGTPLVHLADFRQAFYDMGILNNKTNEASTSPHDTHGHHDHDHDHHHHHDHDHQHHHHYNKKSNFHSLLYKRQQANTCYQPDELFRLFGFTDEELTKEQLIDISPALVYLSATKSCASVTANSSNTHDSGLTKANTNTAPEKLPDILVWVYSFAAITIITLSAALGIVFVPMMMRSPYLGDLVMTFFIALAVGVLASDALLHLIPHALEEPDDGHGHSHEGHDHSANVWITTMIMLGIYIFWIFEKFLHNKLHNHHHGHGHSETSRDFHHPPSTHHHHPSHSHPHPPIDSKDTMVSGASSAPSSNKKGLVEELKDSKPVATLVILGDSFHNFVDGMTIGAAFAQNVTVGLSTSFAVLLHEVPHELGDYSVLLASGLSKWRAAIWNMISNISSYIGAIIGIVLVQNSTTTGNAERWVLAFGAGSFLYIALVDLVPEMGLVHVINERDSHTVKHNSWSKIFAQHFGIILGWAIMLLIALYESKINFGI